MDSETRPAWRGGVNFDWEGQEFWAPSEEAAERLKRRLEALRPYIRPERPAEAKARGER